MPLYLFFTFPALITLLALLLYIVLSFKVGQARGKYGIKAPATTGNEDFERYYRVQMNTLEQLVAFLPSLWIYAVVWHSGIVVLLAGGAWIIGRVLFAAGYYRAAEKRAAGFVISFFATLFLLLGSLAGIIMQLL